MNILSHLKLNSWLLVLPLCLGAAGAQARVISTMSFTDPGTPTAGTGDINTASTFDIGNLKFTGGTGTFALVPPNETLGLIAFNDTIGTSFSFTNATVGGFTSSSITEYNESSGSVSFDILGTYIGGAESLAATPASFQVTFTQSPADTGAIADTSILSIPEVVVPEPSTLALSAMGSMVGCVAFLAFRRRK